MPTVNIFDMADTWNDAGTTFTAIKMNVTDTSSAAASLLMDLQVGGTSKFKVSKTVATGLLVTTKDADTVLVDIVHGTNDGGFVRLGNSVGFGRFGGIETSTSDGTHTSINSDTPLGFGSGINNPDTYIRRDAAGTLAHRDGTNAQILRGYRTFTDASNYERWALQSGSGYFELAAETAGTGTDNIHLRLTPSGTASVQINGTGTNDSANAGDVGEIIESEILVASAVALTTATAANVTSISLTAGDWDVWGNVWFNPAATTSITIYEGGINTTSATLPTAPAAGARAKTIEAALVPNAIFGLFIGQRRISVASTTTVYLVAQATFTIDTLGGYGYIGARRVR